MSDILNIKDLYFIESSIVPAILIFSLVWFVFLLSSMRSLINVQGTLRKFKDVSKLHDYIKKGKNYEEYNEEITEQPNELKDAEQIFIDYCLENDINIKSPITKHVNSIFIAGHKESKLEVPVLIKCTENVIFSANAFLKGFSSIFIIMGLLGTLFGLSLSFEKLSPAISSLRTGERADSVASAIESLFSNLGNAFTPSIIGVMVTILSVVLLVTYIQILCNPIKKNLEENTINIWIPELYQTNMQKVVETLQDSEAQLRKNFESATKVADFAQDVQSKFSDFSNNISSANKVMGNMSKVMEKYESTILTFDESVNRLSTYQNELSNYYRQICESNTQLSSFIDNSTKNMNIIQNNIVSSYDEQNQRMGKVIESFEYLKKLSETNISLTNAAEKSFIDISKMNIDVIDGLREPLVKQLNENFMLISKTFSNDMERIVQMFSRIDTPMKESAKSINEVLAYLTRSYENMCKHLEVNSEVNHKIATDSIEENRHLVKNISESTNNIALLTEAIGRQSLPYLAELQKRKTSVFKKFFDNMSKKNVS